MLKSILDSDTYKFTMANAILELYPSAQAEYIFINRDKSYNFNNEFLGLLKDAIKELSKVMLDRDEKAWLQKRCPYLKPFFLEYLFNYQFNPDEVSASIDNGQLVLSIKGDWARTIFWEVPLMAIISELYFRGIPGWTLDGQAERALEKAKKLGDAGCLYADFGTRRRRSYKTQEIVVEAMHDKPGFTGTSNPYLARRFGVTPIGTVAHEFIQSQAVLNGLRHANRFAMDDWTHVYKADLGIMLTDTFGVDAFLEDFDLYHAKLWTGTRQDSGDPFKFVDKMVDHYKKLRIDPMSKVIVFSDSLNVDKAIKLNEYCKGKIK